VILAEYFEIWIIELNLNDQCRTEAKLSENSASLNMKLLENILPSHVAEYFLTDQAKDQVNVLL
jgi:hypothetical protein